MYNKNSRYRFSVDMRAYGGCYLLRKKTFYREHIRNQFLYRFVAMQCVDEKQ